MRLHRQSKVRVWIQSDLPNLLTRRKKNPCILQRIKDALVEEMTHPSPLRKCAGFYITLSEMEEDLVIKMIKGLYEPLIGKIEDDAKLVGILDGITKSFNNGLRVSRFADANSTGWKPLFQFNAETWLR